MNEKTRAVRAYAAMALLMGGAGAVGILLIAQGIRETGARAIILGAVILGVNVAIDVAMFARVADALARRAPSLATRDTKHENE